MKRKNNWNLLGVITLIAMCAFMFISCQQGPTLNPYKTLTLDIAGQQQKLYYGDDGVWYNALTDDSLLIDDNKVAGDDIKFNISETTTKWTVTFKKNIPNGASESDFTIRPASVDVTSELSLSPDNVIDITTGKVILSSISEDVTVTGTYPSKAIGEDVTAESANANYKFEKWTVNGEDIDITTYEVSGNTEVVANWNCLADLKVLTVKDGDVVKDTVYYNLTDSKWYADENMTGEKTSITPPELQEKTYTITIDSENDTPDDIRTVTSSFLGYGVGSEVKVQAGGSLSGYTIDKDTEIVFLWSEEKITEPSQQPIKDGYVFNGWYNGEKSYDFNSVVTGNITITAHWTKKTFNTLTLDIAGQKQELYYGSDSAWYKAVVGEEHLLLNDNKVTGDDIKFNISETTKWTVTFNKNTPAGANADEILISRESVVLTPKLSLSPDNVIDKTSGKVLPGSISGNVTVTGTYPPTAIGESVTASSTNQNYKFDKWTTEGGEVISDIATYAVSGNITIKATWNNTSDFKVLAVKDGDEIVETVYYYTTSKKWYKERSTSSEVKTSVVLPGSTTKTYTITLKYNNGSEDRTSTLNSTFSGYGLSGADSANIPSNGSLSGYTIENDTVLVSKWSEAKITKPENPTRDGYVFDKWTLNDTEYNFENAVTDNITLVAVWTQKTYKTLTLNITDTNTQTLYYGSDSAWYKALSEGGLLIDANKVTGDVKFNIPSAPTWTVTFDKNVPDGASESEFTLSANTKTVTPDLTLTPGNTVDASSGKVKVENISEDTIVTGEYLATAIGESVTASSTNLNYEFEKWTANGEDVANIADYEVSDNITIKATWRNLSSFKVLTVKDGGVVKDTAYYNTADDKWYVSNDITSELKTSVDIPQDRTYTITLDYANDSPNGNGGSVTSSFLGYGLDGNTSAVIEPNGSLSNYTIENDTELVSLWSKEKYSEPSQPTKDGYVFEAWYNGENLYSFDSVVTGDITLTAHWTKKTFNTLTLDIEGQKEQTLYYGSDDAWYSALGEGDLLLDANRVTGDAKFNIPSAPTWTVTLNKNTPAGAKDSEISISRESVVLKPTLSLSPDNVIDKATGKVSVDSIDGDEVVTGTYPPTAIGESVTASYTNVNYEFAGWTVNGKTIENIADYKVSGDTEIVANWNNMSSFKTLTVKDGGVVKDTAWFNVTDGKWYVSNNTTSGKKTSVIPPEEQEKTYTITIDYENVTPDDVRTVTSSFLGYGLDGNTSPVIWTDGSLSNYTIENDTELVSLWSEAKFNEPAQPTKDGYVFNGWYNGDDTYSFDSVVTGDMTLTAHWTKKTFNTLTLDIEGQKEQTLYYGSDNAWYSDVVVKGEDQLLLDENKVTGDVKFNIPSVSKWTVTFNNKLPAGASESEFTITPASVDVTPDLTLTPGDLIDNTGKVVPSSISENKTVIGTYPPKTIGQNVTPSSTNVNYEFAGWMVNDEDIDITTYKVNGDTAIVANWNNISNFKTLTVKDGESKDTAYYNVTDKKWYVSNDITSGEKTSVTTPQDREYTITLNYDNSTPNGNEKVISSFRGYGVGSEVKVPSNGSLSGCTISDATVLVSLWSEAKFNEPSEQPTKDGYVFNGWYNGESPYNFGNVVTGNMTLTAHWTQKTYKTLTLNIGENNYSKVLYYGSDNAWYKALSEGGLLLDANKVTGDVKFNIPELVWKVTFDKNAPNGASESDFTITPASVDVTPDLTLTPDNTVDASSGKVKVESIIENVTVTGKYPPKAIGQSVTPSSDNQNYEFAGWTVNDVTIDNITNYAVSGNITIKATWNNISSFKVLTVKDGGVVKDTAYYNTKDHKWYAGSDITSGEKPSVLTLPNIEYTITLNYDNGSSNGSEKVTSSFLGYWADGNTSPAIGSDGSLSVYTIDKDTDLVSKWSDATFTEPLDKPTKAGYVFIGWYNGESPYDFNSVVTGNMTLTAHWKEKPKKLTVKDRDVVKDTAYYNLTDKKWYANENMTDEKTSVDIPQDRTYTITLDYANDSPNGNGSESVTSSFRGYGVDENTSEVKVLSDGSLSNCTINEDTELVSLWSKVQFNDPLEQPTKDGYVFDKWYKDDSPYDFNSDVEGDMTLTAHWIQKTYKTLTLNITSSDAQTLQTLYYGSDNVWYEALGEGGLLLNDNKVTGDVKFNIPEAPVWTLTLNKNRPQNAPFSDADIILSKNQLTLYPKDGVFSSDEYISKDGIVKVPSITGNVDVTLDTSRRYPSENVEATISRDDIKFLGWKIGDQTITDLSKYEVTADNTILNASWGYKVSIGELKVPGVGISDADRGFYTTTQDIDESVDDKSKQQRVAYYAEGETVKLYYCNSSIRGIEITLKNEWSGETKSIDAVDTYKYKYSLLEIASMANQPLSISFNVTSSEKV